MQYCSQQFLKRVVNLNPDVEIRTATKKDAMSFVSFFNDHYARKTNKHYFHWQFFDSPIPSKLFVATVGQHLVGCCGIKSIQLSSGIQAGFVVDLLVDKEYRKRGIPFMLEEEIQKFVADAKPAVLMAFPNEFGFAAFQGMGWKHVGTIKTLAASSLLHQKSLAVKTKTFKSGKPLTCVLRNEVLRQYRFNQNPIHAYKRVELETDVFAIVKKFQDPISGKSFGDIVDFEGHFADSQQFSTLFLKASEFLLEENCEYITTWALPHAPIYPILTALGFCEIPQERYFCIKILEEKYNFLYDFLSWHLVQADSEVY